MTIVHDQPHSRDQRLRQLGLTARALSQALLRAEADSRLCTTFDPPTFEGTTRWARTVRYLREDLVPGGDWEPHNKDSWPRTLNRKLGITVAVSAGDAPTGEVGYPATYKPSTKRRKGPATHRAVQVNQQTIPGFPAHLVPASEDEAEDAVTWFLLYKVEGDIIRSELSCALTVGENGKVIDWSERIMLDDIDFQLGGATLLPSSPSDGDGSQNEIDVPVRRRETE